jgi:uncharacterized protein (DUF1697 family)
MSPAPASCRYVALFRGINVGKAHRLAMADLQAVLESLGYGEVRTLLNSGNAVYAGPHRPAIEEGRRIRAEVAAALGVDVPVIVKTADDIAAAVADNPLRAVATDPSRLLLAFTRDAASLAAIASIAGSASGADILRVGARAAYLWCPGGILESKAAVALLKGLAETGTTRNAATVDKLHALLRPSA